MPLWAQILIVVLIVLAIAIVALYFYGNKLQRRQVEQEQMLEQMEQTVSMASPPLVSLYSLWKK